LYISKRTKKIEKVFIIERLNKLIKVICIIICTVNNNADKHIFNGVTEKSVPRTKKNISIIVVNSNIVFIIV